jgi:hypothetical protein
MYLRGYLQVSENGRVVTIALEEQFCIFEMSAIFKMAAKTRYKKWAVKIQHCPISSKFDMWVDNDVPN